MTEARTEAEYMQATAGLSGKLAKYADLLVTKGAAVSEGTELCVQAPVEAADFARLVVKAAYARGAKHVTVIWHDDELARLEYENVELDYFKTVPAWKREQLDGLAEAGASFLFLEGSDPMALDGVDPAKPAAARYASNTQCLKFRNGMDFGRNVWCIAGVAVEKWARHVFPEAGAAEAVYRLWLAILSTARADGEDPQAAWESHNAMFEKNKRLLNGYAFDALRYRSQNGTDLTIGMNLGHLWDGGAARTVGGTVFFPNMPTEEVFTSPDRNRADGVVYSAMPLVHGGQVVDDFWIKFEAGKVVDFDARQGKDVLRHIIETDENSCRLGEVALVSKNTPIRQSGILFFDTLYDENASCHLALGTGFPECLEGGLDMDEKTLIEHGVNQSAAHVDFMVGASDMEIVGITKDGEEVPVFTNGRWAWEVE